MFVGYRNRLAITDGTSADVTNQPSAATNLPEIEPFSNKLCSNDQSTKPDDIVDEAVNDLSQRTLTQLVISQKSQSGNDNESVDDNDFEIVASLPNNTNNNSNDQICIPNCQVEEKCDYEDVTPKSNAKRKISSDLDDSINEYENTRNKKSKINAIEGDYLVIIIS